MAQTKCTSARSPEMNCRGTSDWRAPPNVTTQHGDQAGPTDSDGSSIRGSLERWAHRYYSSEARIEDLRRLPGHSGISFAFDVVEGSDIDRLVMRIPPAGVRRQNSTDVLRLPPILRTMRAAGIPVPTVRWYGADEQWFGVPYLIVERVAGSTLPDVFDMGSDVPPASEVVTTLFKEAVAALVSIHNVDSSQLAEDRWAVPVSAQEDIDMWIPLLRKADDASLVAQGLDLRQRLSGSVPHSEASGIVHGDFYSNNWMFEGARLTAVLDWENSTLGPRMWDLAWLATIYDPECWGVLRLPNMFWTPGPEALLEWYEQAGGRQPHSPDWYRALMCYRLACITPVNLRLHRSGRRVDPVWEVFGEAIPLLFERARGLLG
jgi:aminoglycoside phosphotransferase (APT) family kinase protein